MNISAKSMREFRRGHQIAKDVIARRRMPPRGLVSQFDNPPIWQEAYYREFKRALRDGRIKAPTSKGIGGGR